MHAIDRHRACVEHANAKTFERFGVYGPYRAGTDEHSFWLIAFDSKMVDLVTT